MFIGEYLHTIDHKGRVAIPAKFRPRLAGGCVVTRGLDASLAVYPKEEWEVLAKKLARLPLSKPDARAFARLMLAGAMDVELDKQGRIIIPGYLRDYANLSDSTVIAGLYDRMEIWNKEAWDEYRTQASEKSSQISEDFGDINI
jgi:MraZ protein